MTWQPIETAPRDYRERNSMDKSLRFKANYKQDPQLVDRLRNFYKDECMLQFAVWAQSTHLDITGLRAGAPVFRPGACAWEAWKAAWALKS